MERHDWKRVWLGEEIDGRFLEDLDGSQGDGVTARSRREARRKELLKGRGDEDEEGALSHVWSGCRAAAGGIWRA